MRILFYNHAAEVSGAERVLLDIMGLAQTMGHEATLCVPLGALAAEAERQGIAIVPVAPLVLGYTHDPFMLARYLAQATAPMGDIKRALHCLHPHALYANSVRSGLLVAAALALTKDRPRFAVHVHDALDRPGLGQAVGTVLGSTADAIVAISYFVARTIRAPARKVHVLHNAVDPDRYRIASDRGQDYRSRIGVAEQVPLIAVVAQLTPWKGQMDALDAVAQLRAAMPEAHLIVAGAPKFSGKHRRFDTHAYRAALIARSEQPDLQGSVHFVGDVSDVAATYAAADLLVVPSWAEPFGRVVIEAMAAGCPVLATAAGGIPEIITHGIDGWLVPPRNVPALRTAMQRLLANRPLRDRLAAAALTTVANRFTLSRYGPRIEAIWTGAPLAAGG